MTDTLAPAPAAAALPTVKPARPHFSSGPCAQASGLGSVGNRDGRAWALAPLEARQAAPAIRDRPDARAAEAPRNPTASASSPAPTPARSRWRCGRCSAQRPVTALAWESFGEGWVTDAVKQLKIEPTVIRADYGQLPDLSQVDWTHDVLFTWNGTTSGVRVPDADWIPADREGLSIRRRDFGRVRLRHRLDQDRRRNLLLAEGAGRRGRDTASLILGPRAVERLESYTPGWPLPKVFRLVSARAS